ncbi:ABC transporter permease [Dasania marina]|uniref:MlaE family ABC transporter permease n=1 Tax=Dasania marina TaxID=471499 RepID=UPI0030D99908|tara:strand:- start:42317 stop:43483 length:1167 start_codon:yes stop_codon:yes gene_type:complete
MVEETEQLSMICDRDDFRCWQDAQTLNIGLKRDWVLSEVGRLERELAELAIANRPVNKVAIFCGGLRNLDLSGAMLLYRSAEQLKTLGMAADFSGFKAEHFKFIKQVLTVNDQPVITAPRYSFYQRSLQKSTALIQSLSSSLKQRQQFMHTLCQELLRTLQQPRRLRWIATTRHIEEAGVNALPVVVMMAFLIAVVLAFQGQNQLSRFGAEIFTIDLVAISVLREMGVLLTAIMIAGRSGSAFAAEIGVMQLNEEVDAMTTMGIRPFEVLVIPRVLALLISLPLLSFIADIAGLLGTLAVATSLLDIPFNLVIERFLSLEISSHFMVGMIKAPFFAIAIALTACYRGFYVSKSADAVGRNTTRAVVESIFMIIMVDAIFSVIFAQLNW